MRTILQNPFSVEVHFSDDEIQELVSLAEKRQAPKNGNQHATDKRIIKRDNVMTHLIGLLGEFAVSKLVGEPVDTSSYVSGDLYKDFLIYGVKIEVKTLQGYLTFVSMDHFKSDVAVLVNYEKGDNSKVTVQGWITKDEFESNSFVDNFGYGDRPCMQPSDLLPIEGLKQYCLIACKMRKFYHHITGMYGSAK